MHDVGIMNRINVMGEGAYTRHTELFLTMQCQCLFTNFSNVHAALEWAAAHALSDFGEMVDHGVEDCQDD
jgi:hypothetical protein